MTNSSANIKCLHLLIVDIVGIYRAETPVERLNSQLERMKQIQIQQYFLLMSVSSLVVGIWVYAESVRQNMVRRRSVISTDLIGSNSFSRYEANASTISLNDASTIFLTLHVNKSILHTSLQSSYTLKSSTLENPRSKCSSTGSENCRTNQAIVTERDATDTGLPVKMVNDDRLSASIAKTISTSVQTRSFSRGPSGINTEARKWRQFRKDVFVYSAYYRDQNRDIVIIAAALRTKRHSIECTFQLSSAAHHVYASLTMLPDHHLRQYSAMLISCPLPVNYTDDIPNSVEIRVGKRTTQLRVLFPKPRQFNFTVCLSCLHGPYKNHRILIEMVETDLILGAQRFVVFNHSITAEVDEVLQHYVRRGLMEVRPWQIPTNKSNIHYHGQMASIQDCILSSRGESKYVVLKDVDEVIAPHQHRNWNQMMNSLDKGDNSASFLFRNTFFETNSPKFNPTTKNTPIITSLKYIWRNDHIYKNRIRSKWILKPELVQIGGIHYPFEINKGCVNIPVKVSVALLHHYRKFNNTFDKVKDTTMLKYSDSLVSNIMKTYQEIGIQVRP